MDFSQLRRARHVHITGYEGARNHAEYLEVLRKIHAMGDVTVSFDVGWDMTGSWDEGIFELAPMIDVLFMNETECLHYTRCADVDAGIARLAEAGHWVAIKLGKRGAMAARGPERYFAPGYRVKAVDTTGAGDSFNAGFVCGYLEGLPMEECLRYGNGCGALSVTALGGNTAFPSRAALEEFISGGNAE